MSELVTLDDAFDTAFTEVDDAPTSPTPFEEAVSEPAEILEPEQPTEVPESEPEEVEELFEVEDEGTSETTDEPQPVNLDEMTFELPGVDSPVTFQDLKDGYLRQSDYTRKTQAVAEQRKANEKAAQLYEAIQADPMKVARQIAEEVGLVQPGADPVKAVEFSVFQTQEAVEAEIARRVEEGIQNHPTVQQANVVAGQRWVEGEFSKIEQTHNVKLGPKSRQAILKFAGDKGVTDLDLVFNHLNAQKAQRAASTQQVAQAAAGRPTGRAVDNPVTEPADSIESAAERSWAEMTAKR